MYQLFAGHLLLIDRECVLVKEAGDVCRTMAHLGHDGEGRLVGWRASGRREARGGFGCKEVNGYMVWNHDGENTLRSYEERGSV